MLPLVVVVAVAAAAAAAAARLLPWGVVLSLRIELLLLLLSFFLLGGVVVECVQIFPRLPKRIRRLILWRRIDDAAAVVVSSDVTVRKSRTMLRMVSLLFSKMTRWMVSIDIRGAAHSVEEPIPTRSSSSPPSVPRTRMLCWTEKDTFCWRAP